MSHLGLRPPRAALVNLATNETLRFLFNPQTFEEKIEPIYAKQAPVGLSHQRLQYTGTQNNIIPIELYLSQLHQDALTGTAGSTPTILEQKAWLQSLCYPAEISDVGYGGPPRVLFVWPQVIRLQGRIKSASFLHREFSNRSLATIQMVAKLEFEEDADSRKTMEDVKVSGTVQAGEER